MSKLKYVVLSGDRMIIFSADQKHSDFLRLGTLVSAGFIGRSDSTDRFYTYGRSESLALGSRPEDQALLNQLFNVKEHGG